MFIKLQSNVQKQNVSKTDAFHKPNRLPLIIGIIVVAIVLLVVAFWPLINRLIPPKCYSGVELYTSGAFLKFEDGELFGDCVSQLPFAKDSTACSFSYYDFWFRDAVLKNDPFPDVYVVQLEPEESYGSVKQYLEEQSYEKMGSEENGHILYYLGESEDTDCFYVSVNDHRQEVFCFLITDCSTWACVDIFLAKNLGWIPGE